MKSNGIENFFREYHVGTLPHRCGIRKCRGISPMVVLHCLFSLSFLGDDIFRHMVIKTRQPFGKDVVCDFLRSERFNWKRLLLLLSARACSLDRQKNGTPDFDNIVETSKLFVELSLAPIKQILRITIRYY